MPVAVRYPGGYVDEIPSGLRTITGVATSITAFVAMMRSCARTLVMTGCLLGCLGALGPPAHGVTVQSFDAPGTAFTPSMLNNDPPPALLAGPSGNLLRLAASGPAVPIHNTIAFRRSDPGPFCGMNAQFDLRLTPGVGRADGLGFALLDTSIHRTEGAVTVEGPLFAAEEPNFLRSLGVGFDIHQGVAVGDPDNNHVSVHWNGVRLAQVGAGAIDLASGQFVHVEIVLAVGSPSTVTVRLTPSGSPTPTTIVNQLAVAGLAAYESRVWFGARSGGQTADHDLDNVNVTFTACPASQVGAWSAVEAWPVVAIHAHYLPTHQVMFWDRHDCGEVSCSGDPRFWDPATGAVTNAPLPPEPHDLFCSGHVLLPDGRLFVTGGHIMDNFGQDLTSLYDPASGLWQPQPPMNAGRWYPTATALANGDVLVTSGIITPGAGLNTLPQVWEHLTGTWRALTAADRPLPLYPWMFLAPNGQVFTAGPQQETGYYATAGAGAWTSLDSTAHGFREYGSAVLYDDGKVMIAGGGQFPPTAAVEVIDLDEADPDWREVAPMKNARIQLTLTLLPDGSVLATGGSSAPGFTDAAGGVYTPELWNPASETWTTLAAASEVRLYHSVALLLPDARVLVAGGGHPNGGNGDFHHRSAEIFSPPYLFRGPRPTLSGAPERVAYGESFFVGTPDGAEVAQVTWLRLGSVTHAFNMNQRINRLAFATTAGGLTVTAPASRNLCPPGHYLLFLLDGDGVPSVAKIVQIGAPEIFADGFETGDTAAWSLVVP
jgi:hypothetical protein